MADQSASASLYGRPDSIFIFVASNTLADEVLLRETLLHVLADVTTQALRAEGIQHVCIVHAFGEIAEQVVREAKTRLSLLQRPEVQQSYVFEVDADSVDGENPPRFVLLIGCSSCPTRKAARHIVRTILEHTRLEESDLRNVPVLIVEARPGKQDREAGRSPSMRYQVVLPDQAARAMGALLTDEEGAPRSSRSKRPRQRKRQTA